MDNMPLNSTSVPRDYILMSDWSILTYWKVTFIYTVLKVLLKGLVDLLLLHSGT